MPKFNHIRTEYLFKNSFCYFILYLFNHSSKVEKTTLLFLLSELCKESIVIVKKFDCEILTYLYVLRSPKFIYAFPGMYVCICVSFFSLINRQFTIQFGETKISFPFLLTNFPKKRKFSSSVNSLLRRFVDILIFLHLSLKISYLQIFIPYYSTTLIFLNAIRLFSNLNSPFPVIFTKLF